jgi:hypothetical protein
MFSDVFRPREREEVYSNDKWGFKVYRVEPEPWYMPRSGPLSDFVHTTRSMQRVLENVQKPENKVEEEGGEQESSSEATDVMPAEALYREWTRAPKRRRPAPKRKPCRRRGCAVCPRGKRKLCYKHRR